MDHRRLAQYAIEASIASGGMGDVWKAQDARLLRPVALEILKDQTGNGVIPMSLTTDGRFVWKVLHPVAPSSTWRP
jgi:serine/threonine-protein kinase